MNTPHAEEDKLIGKKSRGEGTQTQENQTKTHREHGGAAPRSGTLTGPLAGTLVGTLDGVQKRHLRKTLAISPKRRSILASPSRTRVPLGGHPFGNSGGGTRPLVRIRFLVRVLSFSMVVLSSKVFSFQVASRFLECLGPGGDHRWYGGRFPDGGQSVGHLFVRLGCGS